MKPSGALAWAVVWLAVVGLTAPPMSAAEPPVPQAAGGAVRPIPVAMKAAIPDVALGAGGVLRGQLVDPQGRPVPGANVVLRQQDQVRGATQTLDDGTLSISGLTGGVYQLTAGEEIAVVRLWAPGTAPPAAQPGALLVTGQTLVRGQSAARSFFTSPWVLATLLGAAIIVPIALNNREKVSTS